MKLVTRGFSGSFMTNMKPDFTNSKWRSNFPKMTMFGTRHSVVFGVADYEFGNGFQKFKVADLIWRSNLKKIIFVA